MDSRDSRALTSAFTQQQEKEQRQEQLQEQVAKEKKTPDEPPIIRLLDQMVSLVEKSQFEKEWPEEKEGISSPETISVERPTTSLHGNKFHLQQSEDVKKSESSQDEQIFATGNGKQKGKAVAEPYSTEHLACPTYTETTVTTGDFNDTCSDAEMTKQFAYDVRPRSATLLLTPSAVGTTTICASRTTCRRSAAVDGGRTSSTLTGSLPSLLSQDNFYRNWHEQPFVSRQDCIAPAHFSLEEPGASGADTLTDHHRLSSTSSFRMPIDSINTTVTTGDRLVRTHSYHRLDDQRLSKSDRKTNRKLHHHHRQSRSRRRTTSVGKDNSLLFSRSLSCSVGMMAPATILTSIKKRDQFGGSLETEDEEGDEDKSDSTLSLEERQRRRKQSVTIRRSRAARNQSVLLTNHQRLILTSLCCLAFASQCSMSIIAPFFPFEASQKGLSESVYGLVFSIHAFVVMVFSPLLGVLTPKLGAKQTLLCGIAVSGIANILFGALDYVEDVQTFTWLCFLVRSAEALGSCAFSTASYVYIMHHFGDQLGWTFGVLETFVGLGMSLGPGIGGGLYGLGGYALPFYLLGLITLVNLPFAWMVLPLLGNVMESSLDKTNIHALLSQTKTSSTVTASSSIKNDEKSTTTKTSSKTVKPGATQSCEYSPMDWPSDSKSKLMQSSDIWRMSGSATMVETTRTNPEDRKSTSDDDGGYSAGSSSPDYGSLTHRNYDDKDGNPSAYRRKRLSYAALLRMPQVLLICLVIIVISQSQGFLDPTVEPHLRRYGLKPHLVGLIFLLMSAAYAMTSPLIGWWSGRSQNKLAIMAVGCFITWIGLMLVGPSRFTHFEPSIFFSTFGMVVIGVGFATAFIPTFEALLIQVTEKAQYPDNVRTYSLVSGLWSSLFAMGEVIGPTLGGILSEFYDFPAASSFMALIALLTLIVLLIALLFQRSSRVDNSSWSSPPPSSSSSSSSSLSSSRHSSLSRTPSSSSFQSWNKKRKVTERTHLLT